MVEGMDPKDRKQFLSPFYFRVKGTDVINVKQLYTVMHEWFVEEEYCDGDDDKFPEVFYYESRKPSGKDYQIYWFFAKHPFGDTFFNRSVEIEMRINGIKDIEIQYNGNKIKSQKGTVEIKTWWYLDYDAEKNWREHWFLKHVLEIYVYRMYKRPFELKRQEVLRDAQSFQAALKEYLSLFSFKSVKPDLKRVVNLE